MTGALAGVLAWWVPGSQDVIDGIGATPPKQDSEPTLTDAVRRALEEDPFVGAERISVRTRGEIVTIEGGVPRAAERKLAEDDAWYVLGVHTVVNDLAVRP
jgi:osmotically-inducible protein OsmY